MFTSFMYFCFCWLLFCFLFLYTDLSLFSLSLSLSLSSLSLSLSLTVSLFLSLSLSLSLCLSLSLSLGSSGQLGNADTTATLSPILVKSLHNDLTKHHMVQVAFGDKHTIAITSMRVLVCISMY